MTSQTVEAGIRELLAEVTRQPHFRESAADISLEALGLDSVSMIELVFRLEDHFRVTIADEEVLPENFATIQSLTALVARKCL